MNDLEPRAEETLRALLAQVSVIRVEDVAREKSADGTADLVVRLSAYDKQHELLCVLKSSGLPREVRLVLPHLRILVENSRRSITPVFIAPYLTPQSRALCQEHRISYLDLEGNCRLVFNGVYIERTSTSDPPVERRKLKSLFRPKSAQVLRTMLRDPARPWRVAELAEAASVSLGHVSNVRSALLDREWAATETDGMSLTQPDALLDAWKEAYEPPAGERYTFYTTLHGLALDAAVREVFMALGTDGHLMLASYSAAHWLAPYARIGTQFFYSDNAGLGLIQRGLKLTSASRGENIVVTCLEDDGLFLDRVEPAPGVISTSLVQTYLDLQLAGERGREAAEYLRQRMLKWR